MSSSPGFLGITRRGFLLGAAAGLAAGAPLGWLASRQLPRFTGQPREEPRAELAMPGRYRGRVVRVHHPHAVRPDHTMNEAIVRQMVHDGLTAFVNGDPKDPVASWQRFFNKDDVVGIKVNPVGRAPNPGEGGRVHQAVGCISSPAVIIAVVEGLVSAGVPRKNIILFERYANEFIDAGYEKLMRSDPLRDCRWYAAAAGYSDTQLDIKGFDGGRDAWSVELAKHVVGYDPDVFQTMGFCAPQHDQKDDRRYRSHVSCVVSRLVNKFITIPNLKDHRSAGVTIALKNMSHGMNNNVARSHVSGVAHGLLDSAYTGPNQCNTFIPQAVNQKPIRQKATLHILDGLIGVYEGGPGCWNRTWGTWHYNSLLFATDPVAMDHVGWDIIDRKREQMGWPSVARMGLTHITPEVRLSSELAAWGGRSALNAAALAVSAQNLRDGRASEAFDLRTPQHVSLAGDLGLGDFDPRRIDYRTVELARRS